MHAKEIESEARATLCSVKNGMRVRLGEGSEGRERDREGKLARKEVLSACARSARSSGRGRTRCALGCCCAAGPQSDIAHE